MSVADVDYRKVAKVLAFGLLVWALTALAVWASGVEWLSAVKVGVGVAVGWVSGNLSDTGLIVPTARGLSK